MRFRWPARCLGWLDAFEGSTCQLTEENYWIAPPGTLLDFATGGGECRF